MTSTNSAPAASSSSSSSSSSDSESDHEHSEDNSTYSAELQTQGINDHHQEEERLTEAEKNERLQKKLMVSSGSQDTTRREQPNFSWSLQKNLLILTYFDGTASALKYDHGPPQFR